MLDGTILLTAGLLFVALIFAGLLLVFSLFVTRGPRGAAPGPHAQTDLANMMILFQTMRDVVHEQKQLALQFNASLDKKFAVLRDMVEAARREREELLKAQHALRGFIETARTEFERRAQQGPPPLSSAPSSPPPVSAPAVSFAPPAPEVVPVRPHVSELRAAEASFDVVAELREETEDLIEAWAGLDFGGDAPDPDDVDALDEAPSEPEDPAAARDAFRKLLNIESSMRSVEDGLSSRGDLNRGNGRSAVSPLHQRVYEYADAGMSEGDIARELGVGKGEVRMIVSLRGKRA